MKRFFVMAVAALAFAQERAGAAALGAVSGAVVLGPVGAVAGAVIGYTAGPSIAHSWGVRGSRTATSRQRPQREANRAVASSAPPPAREPMQANGQMVAPSAPPPQAAPEVPTPTSTPPVQGFD